MGGLGSGDDVGLGRAVAFIGFGECWLLLLFFVDGRGRWAEIRRGDLTAIMGGLL